MRRTLFLNHNITKSDILIVGAGPVGCVLAERSAKLKILKCLQ